MPHSRGILMYLNIYQMLIMWTHHRINHTVEFMNIQLSIGDRQVRGVINAKTRKDFRGCFGEI